MTLPPMMFPEEGKNYRLLVTFLVAYGTKSTYCDFIAEK